MGSARKKNDVIQARASRPATSREGRQARLENMALDLIEKRFLSGEASSQETTLFARSAMTRGRIEEVRLEAEVALMRAKQSHLESQEELTRKFEEAIRAMASVRMEDPENEYLDP